MSKLNSVIVRTVAARGDKGRRDCEVLFDSGATDSFVTREVAEALSTILPLTDPNAYTLADGSKLHVSEGVTLSLWLSGYELDADGNYIPARRLVTDQFKINPTDGSANLDDVILGATTMSKYGLSVDFKHNGILFSLKHDVSPSRPGVHQQQKGAGDMNELLKRILARMGMTEIPDSLTDEDAISMICERYSRGYKAVAAPGILTALALKADATEVDVKTAIEALKTLKKPEPVVTPAPSLTYAPVFAKLGLTASADVTEAQAVDLIAAQVKKPVPATAVASKAIFTVLHLPDSSTEEEVVGAILATQHPGNVVTVDQHKDLEKQHREFRLNTLITSAMQGGKLTPAEKGWALEKVQEWDGMGLDGLATFEQFLDKRPKLMPIGERLPMKTPTEIDLDPTTMAVARQMGVSAETMKKYAA